MCTHTLSYAYIYTCLVILEWTRTFHVRSEWISNVMDQIVALVRRPFDRRVNQQCGGSDPGAPRRAQERPGAPRRASPGEPRSIQDRCQLGLRTSCGRAGMADPRRDWQRGAGLPDWLAGVLRSSWKWSFCATVTQFQQIQQASKAAE